MQMKRYVNESNFQPNQQNKSRCEPVELVELRPLQWLARSQLTSGGQRGSLKLNKRRLRSPLFSLPTGRELIKLRLRAPANQLR